LDLHTKPGSKITIAHLVQANGVGQLSYCAILEFQRIRVVDDI